MKQESKGHDRTGLERTSGIAVFNAVVCRRLSLKRAELLEESDGAQVVYLEGFEARDGSSSQPLLVQKSDGGFM